MTQAVRHVPARVRWEHLSKLVWPVAALAVILLFNFFFTPGFFHIEVRDGRLFGSLVDILNRSVPVMLLSAGMTLVIATSGVDLSVGAVMAMAGACVMTLSGCEGWMGAAGRTTVNGCGVDDASTAAVAVVAAVVVVAVGRSFSFSSNESE